MSKVLGQYAVHLVDDAGALRSFLPGDVVPDWAAKLMGPHCFADGGPVDVEVPAADPVGPPPKAGKGSGEDKWRAYAEQEGVDVSSAEGRDDVIDLLDQAGVPVE